MNTDDPIFTAYALNALSAEEKESIEPDVLADREMWSEAELTAAFAEKLKKAFTVEENARLSAVHWREIYAEAGIEDAPGILPFEPEPAKRRLPAWAVAAAAGVAIGAVVASLAITWNDIIPKFSAAPQVKPAEAPVSITIPETPALAAAPVPESEPPGKSSVISIPRPQSLPVVAADDARRALPTFVRAKTTNKLADTIGLEDQVVEVIPVPDLVAVEPPVLQDEVPVQPRNAPLFPPLRAFPRTVASADVPKPQQTNPVSQPPAAVSVASQATKAAAVPFVKKQSASLASVAQVIKPAGTRSQTGNSQIASADVAPLSQTADPVELDTSQFRTLNELNQVAIPDPTAGVSGFFLGGFRHSFSLIENPQVKFTAVFDNAGLPIEITPGNASVLYISEPYTVPANP